MYKNNISLNSMNKTTLKKLTKLQLIKLLFKQQPKIVDDTKTKRRPIPAPRKNIKKMIEENIIDPPIQDKPTITLRKKKLKN